MSEDRHRHANRDIIIVPVPVPVAGADWRKQIKPPNYPQQQRQHWNPRTTPPSKAVASKRLLDAIVRQDQIVREFMRPDAAMIKAWLSPSSA